MPCREEWNTERAITIAALAAQGRPWYFQHNDIIYMGFFEPEPMPGGQDIWYKATVRASATPTRFRGSTVVTPLTLTQVTLLEPLP